jgi:HAE1 family hydrophobic/amphiphilic exporter-1/multidrug efflux pump
MEVGYKNLLQKFIAMRWMAWVIVLACLLFTYLIGRNLQSELAPLEDKSSVRFQITGPEGASYGFMSKAGEEFGNFLIDSIPERAFSFMALPSFSSTGLNSGMGRVGLVPPSERTRSQSEIIKDLIKKLGRFNNLRIFPVEEQTISVGLGSRGALPVQ